ncbi:MAG: T9SS type A sorting domain-containing protein [Bacteroidota bacterium]|nr:T9SS type A sorting domain-containing protein [Bacteroidota bacterium]
MSAEPAAEDTFTCASLSFDYSQVSHSVVESLPASAISIHQSSDHLITHADREPISLRLVSVLGEVVLARNANQDLDIDLSLLPPGVYFAEVICGGQREVRRIIR